MCSETSPGKKAMAYFLDGYNCAQSVLLAMFESWKGRNELVPKIATALGGGIGRCGSVCGALTGGVLAIGARYGSNEPSADKRARAYELSQILYRRFESQHRSVLCRELIHYDLTKAEELEKARKSEVFEKECPKLVKSVVEILLEISEH